MDERSDRVRLFSAFYARHYGPLRDYVARRFGSNDADDIAQETMLRALANLEQLTDGRPAMPWLCRVAHHIAVDGQRRRRPEAVEDARLIELSPAVPDQVAEVTIRVDVGGVLQRAMRRLSPRERQALALREVHGFAVGEIARLTGSTSNTVRQRLFRARQNLTRYYRDLGGGSYPSLPPVPLVSRPLPRPLLQAGATVQRHAAEPGSRLLHRSAAAVAALSVAGATLTSAPPPPAAAGPAGRPPATVAAPPGAVARVPGVPAATGLAGPGRAVERLLTAAVPGRPGLPLTEYWREGLDGWTVSGREAAPGCRTGLETRCVSLDPHDSVELTRPLDVPLPVSTTVRTMVEIDGTTGPTAFALKLGLPATAIEVAITPDGAGRHLSARSSTGPPAAAVSLPATGRHEIWVRLDPATRTVTVSQPGNNGPYVTTHLRAAAPLTALTSITLAARRTGAQGGPVRVAWVELDASPECHDGEDDDGDGAADLADEGCSSMWDDAELDTPQCDDGVDNDGDGFADYPEDTGCAWQRAGTEAPACSNGTDDDGDGFADYPDDPKCASLVEDSEFAECADGMDGDRDGTVDYPDDPGCASAGDDTEWACVLAQVDAGAVQPAVRLRSANGLCVDPIERIGTLLLVAQAPAHEVAGFVDLYRFAPPGAPAQEVLCVELRAATRAAPCAALGGTFVRRVGRLVDVRAEPAVAAGRTARVGICAAALTTVAHNEYLSSPFNRRQVALSLC